MLLIPFYTPTVGEKIWSVSFLSKPARWLIIKLNWRARTDSRERDREREKKTNVFDYVKNIFQVTSLPVIMDMSNTGTFLIRKSCLSKLNKPTQHKKWRWSRFQYRYTVKQHITATKWRTLPCPQNWVSKSTELGLKNRGTEFQKVNITFHSPPNFVVLVLLVQRHTHLA